jgi:cell division protein ZapA
VSTQDTKSAGIRRAPTSTSSKGADQSGPITIEIQGQRLSIRSDREAAFVHSLARYIDNKLGSLQSAAPTAPMDKLLMLASMTVAEELFETRQELRRLRSQLEEKTESIFELIDRIEEI